MNLRESLNKIDAETNNQFDLLNLYESDNLNKQQKKVLFEMLSKEQVSNEEIYDYLNEGFLADAATIGLNKIKTGLKNLGAEIKDTANVAKTNFKAGLLGYADLPRDTREVLVKQRDAEKKAAKTVVDDEIYKKAKKDNKTGRVELPDEIEKKLQQFRQEKKEYKGKKDENPGLTSLYSGDEKKLTLVDVKQDSQDPNKMQYTYLGDKGIYISNDSISNLKGKIQKSLGNINAKADEIRSEKDLAKMVKKEQLNNSLKEDIQDKLTLDYIKDNTKWVIKYDNGYRKVCYGNELDDNLDNMVSDYDIVSWEAQPDELKEFYKDYEYANYELNRKDLYYIDNFYNEWIKDKNQFKPKKSQLEVISDLRTELNKLSKSEDVLIRGIDRDGYTIGLGNHKPENWIDALNELSTNFYVIGIEEASPKDYKSFTIVIKINDKDFAEDFASEANDAAIKKLFANESLKESYSQDYIIVKSDDFLDGLMNNADDETIDKTVMLLKRYARILKSKMNNLYIIHCDYDILPSNNDAEQLDIDAGKYAKVYDYNEITVIEEEYNNEHYLYFKTEDDAEKYLKLLDEAQELTEAIDNKKEFQIRRKLRDLIIEILEAFIELDYYEFPEKEFLADSWEDLLDGVKAGVDDEIETADGLKEYLKKNVYFNIDHPEIAEDDPMAEDEEEWFNKLVDYLQDLNDLYRNESLKEDYTEDKKIYGTHNTYRELADALEDYLRDNKIYNDVEVEDEGFSIYIDWGDWKHEHARLRYYVDEFLTDEGLTYNHDEEVTEEDGSDTYSAIHYFNNIRKK